MVFLVMMNSHKKQAGRMARMTHLIARRRLGDRMTHLMARRRLGDRMIAGVVEMGERLGGWMMTRIAGWVRRIAGLVVRCIRRAGRMICSKWVDGGGELKDFGGECILYG
jgi:hypothetical protein